MEIEAMPNLLVGMKLFSKQMNAKQFLFLLQDLLNEINKKDAAKCLGCWVSDYNEYFYGNMPKFDLNELKEVWEKFTECGVLGSNVPSEPCRHTLDLVKEMAINNETEQKFTAWVKEQ